MKFLNSGNIVRLPLEEIHVEGRLREVKDSFVDNLVMMAEDTGITTPIHVRKISSRYVLIDGAHRLAAAKKMELPDIAALVVQCRADEARAMEASNNLGAARMTPLQTAVFVASWKRDYYAMHPERKPGVFKGNQHTGNLVGDTMSLTKTIADAFGVDERTVHRALKAGESLTAEEAAQLDAAPNRVTMKDLNDLAKVADAEVRGEVVARLYGGACKNAAAALKALKPANDNPDKNPVEAEVSALSKAWLRASMVARRRWITENFTDLSPLVVDEAETRDEIDAAALRQILTEVAAE